MNKKKTGILTLSAAQNYGAVLQSFSLMRFLQENYGDTEIISFTPQFIIGRYKLIRINKASIMSIIISLAKGIIKLPVPLMTRLRFVSFRKKYCQYSKRKYFGTITDDEYDQYIVGSDQVYNLTLTRNDVNFFLPFVQDVNKKATYAASIGLDRVSVEQKKILAEGLKEFSHISIRESAGAEVIKGIFQDKEIFTNIDPVFLHDKEFWSNIAADYTKKKRYVLIFAFEAIEQCIEIAKLKFSEYSIIRIADAVTKYDPSIINQKGVGPKQFLGLIKNAESIITDSFHGCAFSILFEKTFYVIPYEKTTSRMTNLLTRLGLDNRLVVPDKRMSDDIIDYESVKEKIEMEKKSARKYFDSIFLD